MKCLTVRAKSQFLLTAAPLWQCQFDDDVDLDDDVIADENVVLDASSPLLQRQMCGAAPDVDAGGINFAVRTGATPSSNTGPDGAFSGRWYVFIEATDRPDGADAV